MGQGRATATGLKWIFVAMLIAGVALIKLNDHFQIPANPNGTVWDLGNIGGAGLIIVAVLLAVRWTYRH